MKRIIGPIRAVLICMVVYLLFSTQGYWHLLPGNQNLEAFIVGKWEGQRQYIDTSGSHIEKIRLDFSNSHILTYSSSLSHELEYGIVFRVEVPSQKELILTGRIRDEWQIDYSANYLSIRGGIWKNQVVFFERVLNVGPILVSVLAILIFEFLFSWYPYKGRITGQKTETGGSESLSPLSRMFEVLLPILIFLSGLLVGKLLADLILYSKLILSLNLPWWPLVLIEFFVWILIIGIKLAIAAYNIKVSQLIISKVTKYLGVFLIGASVYGLVIGTVRLFFLYILQLLLTQLI